MIPIYTLSFPTSGHPGAQIRGRHVQRRSSGGCQVVVHRFDWGISSAVPRFTSLCCLDGFGLGSGDIYIYKYIYILGYVDSILVEPKTQVPTPNYTGTKRNWELNSDFAPRTRGPMSLEAHSLTYTFFEIMKYISPESHLTYFLGFSGCRSNHNS